jgi:hypothetical protein
LGVFERLIAIDLFFFFPREKCRREGAGGLGFRSVVFPYFLEKKKYLNLKGYALKIH